MTRSKYNSKKVSKYNRTWDSTDELSYYEYLLTRDNIKEIQLQPKLILLDAYTYFGKRKQAITYSPDFKVTYSDLSVEYIDVKGFGTQQGDLRRKLFESRYNDCKLTWVSKSIKWGVDGWVDYDELKRLRAKNKKKDK